MKDLYLFKNFESKAVYYVPMHSQLKNLTTGIVL